MARHTVRRWVLHAGVMFAMVSPLGAQAVVSGRVVSDTDGAPVGGAEVLVQALGRVIRSGADGSFVLSPLPVGTHRLLIRQIGFDPLHVDVELAGNDTIRAEFVLSRRVQALEDVTVTEEARSVGRFAEFERRRGIGSGVYLTRADLDKRDASKLSDILRGATGLRFVYRARGGIALANGRFAGDPGRPQSTAQCYMQVFVDGVRVYRPAARGVTDIGVEPPNLDQFAPNTIQGIEVYRGPAETPPEFGGSAAMCGTLVIWTRSG